MKKYIIGAVVFAVLLVVGFFGFSLVKANINERTLPEEWRSWLPAEEKSVDMDDSSTATLDCCVAYDLVV